MTEQPTLQTARLRLRPFAAADAAVVQRLAGDRAIAATTANVPHPYPEGAAEAWIASHAVSWGEGRQAVWAMERREDDQVVGAIGLRIGMANRRAELGYWVGTQWWGNGYATEAGLEVVRYGFETIGLNRVMARHFRSNPASGRVMQKIGMKQEGVMREHFLKWGRFEDMVIYGLLAGERQP